MNDTPPRSLCAYIFTVCPRIQSPPSHLSSYCPRLCVRVSLSSFVARLLGFCVPVPSPCPPLRTGHPFLNQVVRSLLRVPPVWSPDYHGTPLSATHRAEIQKRSGGAGFAHTERTPDYSWKASSCIFRLAVQEMPRGRPSEPGLPWKRGG